MQDEINESNAAVNINAVYEPGMLMSALRDCMLAVLSKSGHNSAALSDPVLFGQYTQILSAQTKIVAQFHCDEKRSDYLEIDKKMQDIALSGFSLIKGENGQDIFSRFALFLEEQSNLLELEEQKSLFKEQCTYPPYSLIFSGGNTKRPSNIQAQLIVFYAWRKIVLIEKTQTQFNVNEVEIKKVPIQDCLFNRSDLSLIELSRVPIEQLETTNGKIDPFKAQKIADDEYNKARDDLYSIQNQMKTLADSIDLNSSKADIERYHKEYVSLTQKQSAYNYLMEQKSKEASTVEYLKNQIKDNMKSEENSSLMIKETGKALLFGAGITIGKSVLNWAKGEAIDPKLGEKVLTGVLIGVGTAATTYLLGPIGPMISNQALGYFFPEPDPLMEGIKNIQKSIDLGFKQTEKRFDEISSELKKGFSEISAQMKEIAEQNKEYTTLNDQIRSFSSLLDDAESLLTEIELQSRGIIDGSKNTILIENLIQTHNSFQSKLEQIIKRIYNPAYCLWSSKMDPKTSSATESLSDTIITFYRRPNAFFKPYDFVANQIGSLCGRIRLIAYRYFETRAQLERALAVSLIYFSQEGSKDLLRVALLDLHASEESNRADCFAGIIMIERLILGSSIYNLIQTNKLPAEERLSLKGGFVLESASSKREFYNLKLEKEHSGKDGWFNLTKNTSNPNRFYFEKMIGDELSSSIISFSDKDWPRLLQARIALESSNTLAVYSTDYKRKVLTTPIKATEFELSNLAEKLLISGEKRTCLIETKVSDLEYHCPREGYKIILSVKKVGLTKPVNQGFSRSYLEKIREITSLDITSETWGLELSVLNSKGKVVALWAALSFPIAKAVGVGSSKHINAFEIQYRNNSISVRLHLQEFLILGDSITDEISYLELPLDFSPVGGSEGTHDFLADYSFRWGLWTHQNIASSKFGSIHNLEDVSRGFFSSILYPNQMLSSMVSANSLFVVRKQTTNIDDHVYNLYDGSELIGSIFKGYTYKDNLFKVSVLMQEDGNLVVYDQNKNPVSSTDSHKLGKVFLHLSDSGKLHLRSLDSGSILKTLETTKSPRISHDGIRNRWFANSRIDQGHSLKSENGDYILKLEHRSEKNSSGAGTAGYVPKSDWYRHGYRLRLEKKGEYQKELSSVMLMYPQVSHDDKDSDYWDKCSEEMISYLDEKVKSSSSVITFLQFFPDGKLTVFIGSKTTYMFVKSYYGIKPVTTLLDSKDNAEFIRLSNEGRLEVYSKGNNTLLRTLL